MKINRINFSCNAILFCTFFSFSGNSNAVVDLGNGWGPTASEIIQLPKYCQTQFLTKDINLVQKMSPGCDGIHHLCPGKVLINRASNISIPKAERQRILRQAKNEINYVFSRLTPSCSRGNEIRAAEFEIRLLEPRLR